MFKEYKGLDLVNISADLKLLTMLPVLQITVYGVTPLHGQAT